MQQALLLTIYIGCMKLMEASSTDGGCSCGAINVSVSALRAKLRIRSAKEGSDSGRPEVRSPAVILQRLVLLCQAGTVGELY